MKLYSIRYLLHWVCIFLFLHNHDINKKVVALIYHSYSKTSLPKLTSELGSLPPCEFADETR